MTRVAVIGAGAGGLAAVKALVAERKFETIEWYDKAPVIGGLWNYSAIKEASFPVPMDQATQGETLEPGAPQFTSLYKHLTANVYRPLMGFGTMPFPDGDNPFPSWQEIQAYVGSYYEELMRDISKGVTRVNLRLGVEVTGLEKRHGLWIVSSSAGTETAHSVVIAKGRYEVPRIPNVPGLAEWHRNLPGTISHARYYTTNERFKGLSKVLVVGGFASASDLVLDISRVVKMVVQSYRKLPPNLSQISEQLRAIHPLPEIVAYDWTRRAVTTAEGETIEDIDHVVFSTGYLQTLPFLKSYTDFSDPDCVIKPDGSRLRKLYKQMIYIPDPSLVFIGMIRDTVPFPQLEIQGMALARLLASRWKLPSESQMRQAEEEETKLKGDNEDFHRLGKLYEVDYVRDLFDLSVDVDSQTGTTGLVSKRWTDDMSAIRAKTEELAEQRLFKTIASVRLSRLTLGLD